MPQTQPEVIELDTKTVEELRQRLDAEALLSEDHKTLRATLDSLVYLETLIQKAKISVARLKQLVFGPSTEKTDAVLGDSPDSQEPSSPGENSSDESTGESPSDEPASKPPKGHGRNGVDAFPGAERIHVALDSLRPGDSCPQCAEGTIYAMPPAVFIRFTGHAPVQAEIYECERLRCNLCGAIFTAGAPECVNKRGEYDVTDPSMIALLKYGCGFQFNRLAGLQGNLGIPLPASTQYGIISPVKNMFDPILAELIRQAACGELVHNDDTTNRIL